MTRPKRLFAGWYGAMAASGLGFGLLGERRPFGEDMLAHPLIIYCLAAAAALLVLRFVSGRPVPEIIPERALGRLPVAVAEVVQVEVAAARGGEEQRRAVCGG